MQRVVNICFQTPFCFFVTVFFTNFQQSRSSESWMSVRCCSPHRWQEIPPWSLPSGTWQQVYIFFLRRGGHAIIFSDKKNGFRNFVLSVMVEMGVHKKGDGLDPDGLKAKLVFGITQLIYTLITISPVSISSDFFIMIYPYFLSISDLFLLLLLRLVLWLDGPCLQLGNVEWSLLLYWGAQQILIILNSQFWLESSITFKCSSLI